MVQVDEDYPPFGCEPRAMLCFTEMLVLDFYPACPNPSMPVPLPASCSSPLIVGYYWGRQIRGLIPFTYRRRRHQATDLYWAIPS